MKILLSNTQMFRGIEETEIEALLHCLGAVTKTYHKGETILAEGEPTELVGIVLSGMAMVEYSDVWGNHTILGNAAPGAVFAEAYACIPGEPLQVSVSAAEKTEVLFLNVGKVLTTCTNACAFHTKLVRNLLTVCAHRACSFPCGFSIPAPSPSGDGFCPIFPSARKNRAAIPSGFPTTASNWRITLGLTAAPCAMSCPKCRGTG